MFQAEKFQTENYAGLKEKLIHWLNRYNTFCYLDSNQAIYKAHNFSFSCFDFVAGVGVETEITSAQNNSLKELDESIKNNPGWHFGFFSYDFKNQFENLKSENTDHLRWPDYYFFKPLILILAKNDEIEIIVSDKSSFSPTEIWVQIINLKTQPEIKNFLLPDIKPRLTKEEYLNRVKEIQEHIHRGDLYEINFCQEFYATMDFDPYAGFLKLSEVSPAPFSAFFRLDNKFLLSASPERFLKKSGEKLISQPIKGTAARGKTPESDIESAKQLKNSLKERSENIMIVDLVRNDLSRISVKDSVKVDELCGIYSFQQVHQMISTISSISKTGSIEEIIKATFPMGSMTGAPKIKAMQLSEEFETTKRGLYSGAVGYITPENDFDFNVVIRSLQYNAENEYLSYMVGGAITSLSEPEKEYEECLLKASAMEKVLKNE